MRGAWIEIQRDIALYSPHESLPVRGAWIEMWRQYSCVKVLWSLPVRGAWIEMHGMNEKAIEKYVAPCEGSVD